MTAKKRAVRRLCALLAAVGVLVLLYHCPFRYFFGTACPGCGMTRALLAVLRGDLSAAFGYHPLWPFLLPVGMYMGLCANGMRVPHRQQNVYIVFLALVLLCVYAARVLSGDPVVCV